MWKDFSPRFPPDYHFVEQSTPCSLCRSFRPGKSSIIMYLQNSFNARLNSFLIVWHPDCP